MADARSLFAEKLRGPAVSRSAARPRKVRGQQRHPSQCGGSVSSASSAPAGLASRESSRDGSGNSFSASSGYFACPPAAAEPEPLSCSRASLHCHYLPPPQSACPAAPSAPPCAGQRGRRHSGEPDPQPGKRRTWADGGAAGWGRARTSTSGPRGRAETARRSCGPAPL